MVAQPRHKSLGPLPKKCYGHQIKMQKLLRLSLLVVFSFSFLEARAVDRECVHLLSRAAKPLPVARKLNPRQTFQKLVDWIHDEIIVKRKAPGLVVGISGTDSIVAFLAVAEAYERLGKPNRAAAIHYGEALPALVNSPELEGKFWFQRQVLPWLKQRAPQAQIFVDTSIDSSRDGLRWGALLDWSVLGDSKHGIMQAPNDQHWVVGTRNASEDALFAYSNASNMASVQPLLHLWKSEILTIAKELGLPQKTLDHSCQPDCACGRMDLWAYHIPEVDHLLMARAGILNPQHVEDSMPASLYKSLNAFIDTQIASSQFKTQIPYSTNQFKVAMLALPSWLGDWERFRAQLRVKFLDSQKISHFVSNVISEGDPALATEMVTLLAPFGAQAIPEMLTLLNTPGLRYSHQSRMVSEIFRKPVQVDENPLEIAGLAKVSAQLGYLGFRFPQWRFFTKSYPRQASLFEQFGLKRLHRSTDFRDPSLLLSNPLRDELGIGFAFDAPDYYLEFRRAYVLISIKSSSAPVTLVIRNNSHHFGRDRLKEALYVAFREIEVSTLQEIDAQKLVSAQGFIAWPNLLTQTSELSTSTKIRRVKSALEKIGQFEKSFDQWMFADGKPALLDLLDQLKKSSTPFSPIFMAQVKDGEPSWWPQNVTPVTQPTLPLNPAGRLVFMSGERGDFP